MPRHNNRTNRKVANVSEIRLAQAYRQGQADANRYGVSGMFLDDTYSLDEQQSYLSGFNSVMTTTEGGGASGERLITVGS